MFSAGYTTEPINLETPEQWEERWVFDITEYDPSDFFLLDSRFRMDYGWDEDDFGNQRAPMRAWKWRHGLTNKHKQLIQDIIDIWGINEPRKKWNAAAAERARAWRSGVNRVLSGPRHFKKSYPNAIKEPTVPAPILDPFKPRIARAIMEREEAERNKRSVVRERQPVEPYIPPVTTIKEEVLSSMEEVGDSVEDVEWCSLSDEELSKERVEYSYWPEFHVFTKGWVYTAVNHDMGSSLVRVPRNPLTVPSGAKDV